jgi:hypothetical protein
MSRESEAFFQDSPTEDDLGVADFLDGLALGVSEGNAAALAAMVETPCFVLTHNDARTLEDDADIADFHRDGPQRYGSRGVTHTRPQVVRMDEITDRMVVVRVRWLWLDSDDVDMGADVCTYTLRRGDDDEWKVRIIVVHGAEALS